MTDTDRIEAAARAMAAVAASYGAGFGPEAWRAWTEEATAALAAADAVAAPSAKPDRERLAGVAADHVPVLSARTHRVVGCRCMDRVFVRGQGTWSEHLADAILAEWPPPGERDTSRDLMTEPHDGHEPEVRCPGCPHSEAVMERGGSATLTTLPSVEDVARALHAWDVQDGPCEGPWEDLTGRQHDVWRSGAEAVLALFPGRTETEVKAEALREAAVTLRNVELVENGKRVQEFLDVADWLDARADSIEGGDDRG